MHFNVSRYAGRVIVGVFVSAFAVIPYTTFAVDASVESSNRMFCQNVDSISASLVSTAAENEIQQKEQQAALLKELHDHRIVNAEQRTAARQVWDNKHNLQFEKLMSLAQTDIQKEAATTFKTAVLEAQKKRRAAIDSAMTAYQSAIDEELTTQHSTVADAHASLKAMIESAIEKAKSSCSNESTAPASIQAVFSSDIKSAMQSFERSSLKKLPKKGELTSLKNLRNAAITEANKEFTVSLEKARADASVIFSSKK